MRRRSTHRCRSISSGPAHGIWLGLAAISLGCGLEAAVAPAAAPTLVGEASYLALGCHEGWSTGTLVAPRSTRKVTKGTATLVELELGDTKPTGLGVALTCGHCLDDDDVSHLGLGYKASQTMSDLHEVVLSCVFPGYRRATRGEVGFEDIGLVILDEMPAPPRRPSKCAFVGASKVVNAELLLDDQVTLLGFGDYSANGMGLAQKAGQTIKAIPASWEQAIEGAWRPFPDYFFFAKDSGGVTCHGDSGGPVFWGPESSYDSRQPTIVGVQVWTDCDDPFVAKPGSVAIRIRGEHVGWMKQVVRAASNARTTTCANHETASETRTCLRHAVGDLCWHG